MSTDRELLELAAKAVGYEVFPTGWTEKHLCLKTGEPDEDGDVPPHVLWNPLEWDGDALRLAVKLKIDFEHGHTFARAIWYDEELSSTHVCEIGIAMHDDPLPPTRRAIVRAAAAIGDKFP